MITIKMDRVDKSLFFPHIEKDVASFPLYNRGQIIIESCEIRLLPLNLIIKEMQPSFLIIIESYLQPLLDMGLVVLASRIYSYLDTDVELSFVVLNIENKRVVIEHDTLVGTGTIIELTPTPPIIFQQVAYSEKELEDGKNDTN